jgi:beta-lactamase regulating signal transducer with metallopeptidase domain
MIASWMVYAALWALWFTLAAVLSERLALRTRASVRLVWTLSLALSVAAPFTAYVLARSARMPSTVPMVSGAPMSGIASSGPIGASTTVRSTRAWFADPRMIALAMRAAQLDRPLVIVWVSLSFAVLMYFLGGLLRVRALRRGWRMVEIDGVRLAVSEELGPALIGVLRSVIVVPEWVLELDVRARSLMLRHETEHQIAGDPMLLACARFAVVVMPWNPFLWWQLARLRLAVELDCDARVLRALPDVSAYGNLLLNVVRPRRGPRLAGAAFSDHARHLERRIRVLGRHAPAMHSTGWALCAGMSFAAVAFGCAVPAPATPSPGRISSPAPAARKDSVVPSPRPSRVGGAQAGPMTATRRPPGGSRAGTAPVRDTLFRFDTDSLMSLNPSPSCATGAAKAGPSTVKFVVADDDAVTIDHIAFATAPPDNDRVALQYRNPGIGYFGLMCTTLRGGLVRLGGRHSFDGSPIVIRVDSVATVIAVTGSGRVLATQQIDPSAQRYELRWTR